MLAVETDGLTKDYTLGFWRRRPKRALDGLSLRIEPSEVFGLLGPNGAGKSTTLKILIGLVFPTSGQARILGSDVRDLGMHERIGYLPENPYFYDHLTAEEFLSYAAQLFGLRGAECRRRVDHLLERTGLGDSRRTPLGKFSKGMVQRLGIAQALVNEPDVLILDEPMSGLDPLGRREVRDLILELKAEGKAVLFSTHVLSDAETLCDRVAILNHGRLQGCGELDQLLSSGTQATEVVLNAPTPALVEALLSRTQSLVRTGERMRVTLPAECDQTHALDWLLAQGAQIVSVNPVKMSLEDYFVSQVRDDKKTETRNPRTEFRNLKPQTGVTPKPEARNRKPAPVHSQVSNFGSPPARPIARLVAVALHTFREAVRDTVLYSLVAFALLLIGAAILFGSISVGVEQVMLVNLSVSSISVIGLLMAIFIGTGLVSKEIERRSINNVLSKPVRRAEFILGKYAGLLFTLVVNTAIMTAGFYLALLYEKRSFEAADLAALEAVYLILLELALVVGIALVFSAISTPVLSAFYTFALYLIGNFSDDIRWFGHESGSAVVEKVTAILYYLLPNFADFNAIGQAAHGQRVSGALLASDSLYALLYTAVLLSAAILIFEEREFR